MRSRERLFEIERMERERGKGWRERKDGEREGKDGEREREKIQDVRLVSSCGYCTFRSFLFSPINSSSSSCFSSSFFERRKRKRDLIYLGRRERNHKSLTVGILFPFIHPSPDSIVLFLNIRERISLPLHLRYNSHDSLVPLLLLLLLLPCFSFRLLHSKPTCITQETHSYKRRQFSLSDCVEHEVRTLGRKNSLPLLIQCYILQCLIESVTVSSVPSQPSILKFSPLKYYLDIFVCSLILFINDQTSLLSSFSQDFNLI